MSSIPYNLRELEAFRALIIEGSTTLAARRVGLSQPAISRTISQFEDKIGADLFVRSGGRLTPTVEALKLNDRLDDIFDTLSEIEQNVKAEENKQILSVASSYSMTKGLLVDAIAEFTKRHSDVEINLLIKTKLAILDRITKGELDIGIIHSNGTESSSVTLQPFRSSEVKCIYPKGHEFSELDLVRITDLVDQPLIGIPPERLIRRQINSEFRKLGKSPNWVVSTRAIDIIMDYVGKGLGISIVNPFPSIESHLDKVEAKSFEIEFPEFSAFALNPDRPESESFRLFTSHIRNFATNYSHSEAID